MIGKRRSVVCKGLVPAGDGSVKVMPKQLGRQSPSRADDVVGLGRQARFVSGNGADEKLVLKRISANLTTTTVELP